MNTQTGRCLALALSLAFATVPALAQDADEASAAEQGQALDLQGVDLRAFIQDVSRATGSTFILDPRVQGTVTITSQSRMQAPELLGVLLATLRANGLVAIPAGQNTYRVVPDEGAAQQPGSAGMDGLGYATEVFTLRHVDARAAAETLKGLVGRGGVVAPTPQGNGLLIADYADNLARLRALVAQLDQDRSDIRTVPLRNSSAREIAGVVSQLVASPGGGEGARSGTVSVIAVESSNTIMLRGDPAAVERIATVVVDLDQRASASGDVRVVRLQHADAEQLLPVLQQLVGQSGENNDGTAAATAAGNADTSAAPSLPGGRRAKLARFPGANAIVIAADAETQRMLADVIAQLDTRRAQVLVEAIVVEVSDGTAKKLGVQFLLAGKDGNVPFAATNFPGDGPGLLPLAAAATVGRDAEEGSAAEDLGAAALQSLLGTAGGLLGIGGSNSDRLFGAIITAVKSDNQSNLLSTPSILTLDNQEARILVGQEVPITTGEVLGDANTNPFRTTERQDVGIQLEVRPQINPGGGITLALRQEVSAIAGVLSPGSTDVVLNKREIETTVQVDDGHIVVLGGLLDQGESLSVDKIPVLGDLPVAGGLFRSKKRERTRTNLMIFIRPTILRTADDAREATAPRYEYMRDRDPGVDAGERAALDAIVQDYLRAEPPRSATPAPAPAQ